ncbi:MAG: HEAT repeat domain-containing protein [Planctomycetota bacterium]
MRIQLLLVLLSAGTTLAPTGSSCPAAPEAPEAAVCPQDPKDEGKETPKQRAAKEKAAVERLNEGLRSKEANVRQAALVDAAKAPYPEVIKTFGKVLDGRSDDVAMIAAELLGRMGDEQALDALRRFATRRKKALAKKPGLQEEVLRAIGRHRSPESTSLLIKGAFEEENPQIRRARVFAVAKLRTEDAAKAIFSEMKKTDVKRLRGRLANVRPALIYLTGTDAGQDPARWLQWWESNRKSFVVPEQAPKLSGDYANQWARFWGDEMTYERRKKRSDRG